MRGPMADESWRFADSHGHEHHYSDERGDHYPTLRRVFQEPWYCHDCAEVHEDMLDHYECLLCGEVIQPGSREPQNPERLMLRSVSAYLNGEYVAKERAEQILSDAKTAQENDGNLYEIKLS